MIAQGEYREAEKYLEHIVEAVERHDPKDGSQLSAWFAFLILGIGSRESRWGLALDEHGTGDYGRRSWGKHGELPPDGKGWGRGLMQIDYAAHEFARTGKWEDPRENILYGAKVLLGSYRVMVGKGIRDPLLTQAAVAGYNRGPGNIAGDISRGLDPDRHTAHGNYSSDSIKRAVAYRTLMEFDLEKMIIRPPDPLR